MITDVKDNSNGIEDLKMRLIKAGIAISLWGVGEAKTVEHLLRELEKEESHLLEIDGKLVRDVKFVGANVYYKEGNKKYLLVEERQEFKDGRIRKRDFGCSVSEKIGEEESPELGIERGIKEELGIDGTLNITLRGETKKKAESQSYPGLQTQYSSWEYDVWLNKEQFNPEGYIEEQPDKTTFFVWKEI